MRRLTLAVVAVVAVLVLSGPALAQDTGAGAGSVGSQQYGGDYDPSSAPALVDGVREASDSAGRGADAANDALSGARSSNGRVAGLTELPDTGGAPLFLPVVGILLMCVGALFRQIGR